MRTDLARRLHHACYLEGSFTLRSGVTATHYFDKYRFESDPRLLREVAVALRPLVPADVDALAGLELGGVPIVTALSRETGLPALFVRKKAKDYGTKQLAEGGEVSGRRLLVVEDVVTSGGQIVASCRDLRALGAQIVGALCVIDRESGGATNLAAEGIVLTALYRGAELEAAARTPA
jgi:orotate phosphoribosyltransferase